MSFLVWCYRRLSIIDCLHVLPFVQGYFLLRFLASQVGEQQFIEFFQLFVKKYHGHLILSQVRLETYISAATSEAADNILAHV